MSYTHGKFVWFTLHTSDVERAKSFYSELFGWSTESMNMPQGTYYVFKKGDVTVGGTTLAKGQPSHWLSYLSVADVDAKAKAAKEAGASVVTAAHDIPTIGREAVVSDPQGAVVALFKMAEGDPPAPKGEGTWHWNELWSQDDRAAVAFYTQTIGYSAKEMAMPTGAYHILASEGADCGGVMKSPDPHIPPMWLGYVHVKDADDTARRAKALGAELLGEVMEVPGIGRFGMLKDPTGAAVGFITPAAAR